MGDFNGDSVADHAVTNLSSNSGNSVTILLGRGDGTFTTAPASPVTNYTSQGVVIGDFNSDGILDLAFADSTGIPNALIILMGNGDGTFKVAPASPTTFGGYGSILVGDFNGDGIPDLAVGAGSGPSLATAAVLNYPTGLAFDTAGNLYIADSNDAVVRRISATTGIITTIAGNGKPRIQRRWRTGNQRYDVES